MKKIDKELIDNLNKIFDNCISQMHPPICLYCQKEDPLKVLFDENGQKYAFQNPEHIECKKILAKKREHERTREERSKIVESFFSQYGLPYSDIEFFDFKNAEIEQHSAALINMLYCWAEDWNGKGSAYSDDNNKILYHKGISLSGPSDIGKTFLMLAFAKEAISHGINVKMIPAHQLIEIVSPCFSNDPVEKLRSIQIRMGLVNCEVLIIDDLFSSSYSDNVIKIIGDFLYDREVREQNFTFITTNMPIKKIIDPENGPFKDNIIKRLGHMTSFFEHPGKPYDTSRLKRQRNALLALGQNGPFGYK